MTLKYKNNAQTTLSAGINDSVTSIAVVDGSVFPTLTGIEYFYMTLEDVSLNREVVKVTARSGNTLTVVRAQDGSVARAFSIGDKAEGRLVAAMLADLSAPSYILAALLTVDGTGSTLDADLLDGQSSAYYLAAGSYTAADVLSKLLTVDGAGSGLDADTVDTYHVGTSGATIPLLSGANTWSTTQTFSSDISTGTTSKVTLGTDGNIEIFRSGGGAFIDFKNSAGDDFDVRISQNGANGLYLTAVDGVLLNGVAIPTISSSDTLSNKTLSSPTLSGTVAGTPTIGGAWTWSTGGAASSTDVTIGNSQSIMKISGGDGVYAFLDSATWGIGIKTAATYRLKVSNAGAFSFENATGFTYNSNTVWHAGNDGSGSGLDADLLDGYNIGTSGGTIPLLNGTNTWSNAQIAPSFTVSNTSSGAPQMIHYVSDAGADNKRWWNYANSGQMYWQLVNDAFNATTTWMNVTRSGMTVSSIALSSNAFTWNGVAIPTISSTDTLSNKTLSSPTLSGTVAGSPTFSGNSTFSSTAIFGTVIDEAIRLQNDGGYISFYNDAGSTRRGYIYNGGTYLSLVNEITNGDWAVSTNGTGTLRLNGVVVPTISSTDTLSNKTLSSPTVSGTIAGSATWSGGQTFNADISLKTSGDQYVYFGASGVGTFNLNRNGVGGVMTVSSTNVVNFPQGSVQIGGNTVWHAGNDGAGSGLDADLLDGLSSAAFAQLSASNTFTGAAQYLSNSSAVGLITVSNYPYSDWRDSDGAADAKNWRFEVGGNTAGFYLYNDAFSGGSVGLYMNRSGTTATTLTWANNTVWHAGNDGAGSGLDADLLDGYSSASFVFQNQGYTASTITFTGIGGNSGNGNADYHIYQESGAWTHPYPDLIFAYHTGIKIMSTTDYGGTKFYGRTPSYVGSTAPLFIVGNMDNATSHVSHAVTSTTTDGFGLEFLVNGTYVDGRYAHRLAKYDVGGGVPLYVQKTSGTAGAWTTIARFGSWTSSSAELEVFEGSGSGSYGALRVNNSATNGEASIGYRDASDSDASSWVVGKSVNGIADAFTWFYNGTRLTLSTAGVLSTGSATYWHSGNDGSGSGLDADLLDGYNVGTSGAAIGLLNAAWTRGNTTTFSQGYGVNFANSGATHGIFDYNNTTLILAYNTGDWTSSVRISSGNTQIYAGGNAMTYDGSTLTVSAGNITASADGVHRFGSGSDTASMSGTSPLLYVNGLYATGIAAKRTGSYAEVGMQSGSRAYLGSYNAYEVNFVRNNVAVLEMNATNLLHLATGGTYWHSGNDGAGSTLDADTVDNVHASQIVYGGSTGKSLGDQSNMNSNTLRSGFYYYNNPSNGPIADWQNWIQVRGDGWGDGNQYGFQISSAFHSNNLYYRRHANAGYDSWFNMWHSGSDGSGSGLDADLLDGYNADINANASTVAVRSSAGDLNVSSIYASNWFRSTGGSGWYNQTYGGGIFMEDTTYVKVYGGKAFYVPNSIDATGNITAYYSDERLKTKTRNVENALDQVSSLTPFFYVENETARSLGYNNLKEQVGLSAQEVQRILPQVVHRAPVDIAVDENGNKYSKSGEDYLTVDYARVVPLLVAAIKELRAEVTELKRAA